MSTKVFTEKQLAYARKANMFEYMLFRGEAFDQVSGKTWEHEAHDALRANERTGVVTWFSQYDEKTNRPLSSFDNAIEFSMQFFQEPYESSVEHLLEFQSGLSKEQLFKRTNEHKPEKDFSINDWVFPDTKILSQSGKDYLKSRFISESTIDWFVKHDYMSSDTKNNILIKWYELVPNGHDKVVGADVLGIYRKPVEKRINKKDLRDEELDRATFKGIANGSKRVGGFFFSSYTTFTTDPKLFVFEAPLEAISYVEIYKDQLPSDSFFHSMAGLKWESIDERIKEIQNAYPKDKKLTVIMCVNNDDPAKEFIQTVKEKHNAIPEEQQSFELKTHLPTIPKGDFNEMLELKQTGKLASRELKEKEQLKATQLRKRLLSQKTNEPTKKAEKAQTI